MTSWTKVTLSSDDHVKALIREARTFVSNRGSGEGIGIFRAREGFALYFSPEAVKAVDPGTGLRFDECVRPDQISVRPAVGAYDDPAAYELTPEEEARFHLDDTQQAGLVDPDADIDDLLRASGF